MIASKSTSNNHMHDDRLYVGRDCVEKFMYVALSDSRDYYCVDRRTVVDVDTPHLATRTLSKQTPIQRSISTINAE
jgi:hypothetical protein